jgi:Tol biopolymer transport system component
MSGSTTTIRLVNRAGEEQARASVEGRVSHARWSPDGDRIVFTVGRSASNGGVLQDLHIWDLGEGEDPAPLQITDTGAAFGAEWLGGRQIWDD